MRRALYRYGLPMWNFAIMYRPRSMASVTATAGDNGRFGSVGRGVTWLGDAADEGDIWTDDMSPAGVE